MRRAALLCLPLALLAACGAEESSGQDAEAVFTKYLVDEGIAVNQEGAEAFVDVADSICASHEAGANDVEVISNLMQSAGYLSDYQVGQLHGAAVAAYCPQYGS